LYTKWSLSSEIASVMAETDLADPRWRVEHLEADRKTYAPEENSALHVTKVARLLRNAGSVSAHRAYNDVFDGLASQHQLSPQQVELIREVFEKLDAELIEARKLKDMPGGCFAIKYSPDWISTIIADQQNARQVMELLQHDVMLRAQQGDPDGAMESCMALLNTARSLGDEPFLISFLIRVAGEALTVQSLERVLAQGFPSTEPLEAMQRRLAQETNDLRHSWLTAVRGERAGHHQLMQVLGSGKVRLSNLTGGNGPLEKLQDYFPIVLTGGYPAHLRFMNQLVDAAKLPLPEQGPRFKALEQSIPKQAIMTRLLAPAMQKVHQAHLRTQASLGATEAGLACERFRLEHKRWPESLDELLKSGKLEAVPHDPIDGEPLRFRRLADGVVIYSIGFDKQDNQGNLNRERPHDAGADLGMRLWDPARRRQPPRAPVAAGAP
jgi:hypothetical protein